MNGKLMASRISSGRAFHIWRVVWKKVVQRWQEQTNGGIELGINHKVERGNVIKIPGQISRGGAELSCRWFNLSFQFN